MTATDRPWPTSGVRTAEDIPCTPGWYVDQNDRALYLDDLGIWHFPVETQRYHPDDGELWPWLGLDLKPMAPVVDRADVEQFVRSNPPRELLRDDEGMKQYIIDGIMALVRPRAGRLE